MTCTPSTTRMTARTIRTDGPDHLEPVAPCGASGGDELDLGDDGHGEGGDGRAEHETIGTKNILLFLPMLPSHAATASIAIPARGWFAAPNTPRSGSGLKHTAADDDHDKGGHERVRERTCVRRSARRGVLPSGRNERSANIWQEKTRAGVKEVRAKTETQSQQGVGWCRKRGWRSLPRRRT